MKRFQAALTQHMSVEVCALLPKFKLTLVRVEPLTDAKQDVQKIAKLPSLPERVEGLAYVLHTSGTTGLPKIVRVPHNCILPNILHLRSGKKKHVFKVRARLIGFQNFILAKPFGSAQV